MIAIHYKKRMVLMASQWAELSPQQYVRVIRQLHKPVTNTWFAADAMLRILTGRNWFSFYLLPADLRWRCYEHLRWVYDKQDCVDQLLPAYNGLVGPTTGFNNLKMVEFHHTEIAYQQYVSGKTENIDALNLLVAVLYRSPKNKRLYDFKRNPDGDFRQAFNANEIEFYEKKIKRWPMAVRLAVFVWYDACREQLFKDYSEAFTGKKKTESYAQGLFEMMRSIAGGKYGVLKDVEQLYVHTAFLEIIASKREADELEKQSKKQTA
jgi:hypothetical protein